MPLAASPQTLEPSFTYMGTKSRHHAAVGRHREVGKIASYCCSEPTSLLVDRLMPIPTKRFRDLIDFGPHSFPLRHAPELEAPAAPLGGAVVREPQEVEHLGLALATPSPAFGRKLAELDQACLLRVQAQRELCQPFFEVVQKALRLVLVLEANDRVVRVSHDDHIACRVSRAPLLDPEIVDVVEIYIGKQR